MQTSGLKLLVFWSAVVSVFLVVTGGSFATPLIGRHPVSSCSYVITSSGALLSWGVNFHGELGDGTTISTTNPVPVLWPEGVKGWKMVAGGAAHALALSTDGQIFTWGMNHAGQLGYGYADYILDHSVPRAVLLTNRATGWKAVAAGNSFCLALASDDQLYGWGVNSEGDLGIGTNVGSVSAPVRVLNPEGVRGWRMIAAGEGHGLAIADNGRLFGWGANRYGQVGNGSLSNALSPVLVEFEAGVS